MYTLTNIIDFITQQTESSKVAKDSDIELDLGCTGDDFNDLIEKYAEQFNVDMSLYLWYFHHSEEGLMSVGNIFFKTPDQRVTHIPITPTMLLEFAQSGKWNVRYPEHTIPPKRYDILVNQIIALIIMCVFIVFLLYKCL
ncbi:MAG: DUF1493 family protein [Candidatus Kapabacteria bacterium]|nr:DUF1493 family protein [Candidatus Kapabacteria bacterium]MBX7154671.1 DUF1493 family protein [Bacteroidota bacterium]